MTQEQFYAEIVTIMAKYQADNNLTITKDEIDAQKCFIDAAKELFIYRDYTKTQGYLAEAIAYLDNLHRKNTNQF